MTFISHAQNFEDVMLWRALKGVERGCYIDVGAGDPDRNTVTRAFYERGWSGINVEPDPEAFQALARRRERDVNVQAALADSPGERRFHALSVPGLGTLDSGIAYRHRTRGMEVRRFRVRVWTLAEICRRHVTGDIHFLNIDVEGAEALVLAGADFAAYRPWIVLAEATAPLTRDEVHGAWEPILTRAGYRFVWFDGLNRFYVAEERHAALSPHFCLPPNVFDGFRMAEAVLTGEATNEQGTNNFEVSVPRCQSPPAIERDRLYEPAARLRQQGRHEEAFVLLRDALARNPKNAAAHHELGRVLMALKRWEAALEAFDDALNCGVADAGLLNDRGVALVVLGRFDQALAAFEQAVRLDPEQPEAVNGRGLALYHLGRLTEALASYDRAVALRPRYVEALDNRGIVLSLLDRYDEALASHEAALSFRPDYAPGYNHRGTVWHALGRYDESLADLNRAISLTPNYAEMYANRAATLRSLHRLADALDDCNRALILQPDLAGVHYLAATTSLALGDFKRGWREYEWRWPAGIIEQDRRDFQRKPWLGDSDLSGKTILLHGEQGFGDRLQFCRYVPLVAKQCRVVLEVPGELLRLLSTMDQGGSIVVTGQELPDFDLHCPLGSLPLAFGTELATIPAAVPYLHAVPEAAESWRGRLAIIPGVHVGIAWIGNARPFDRSFPVDEIARLAEVTGVNLISLQKRPTDRKITPLPAGVLLYDWTGELYDFADTAALVEALDLVITIDSAVAHLAGALGKPVWVLNRFDGCWRWLQDRDDSPWYPTMRLFRQPAPGDWASVTRRVMDALDAFVGTMR